MKPLRVLVVCLGNICRSPTAEVVLRNKLRVAKLDRLVDVDSAGTACGHSGLPPDARSQKHARARGYELSGLRARAVKAADFHRFDLMLAMDEDNLADLERLKPVGAAAALQLFGAAEVPDPYLGGPGGFEEVLDLVEAASDTWVEALRQRVGSA